MVIEWWLVSVLTAVPALILIKGLWEHVQNVLETAFQYHQHPPILQHADASLDFLETPLSLIYVTILPVLFEHATVRIHYAQALLQVKYGQPTVCLTG